jgi:hypothetical protein
MSPALDRCLRLLVMYETGALSLALLRRLWRAVLAEEIAP